MTVGDDDTLAGVVGATATGATPELIAGRYRIVRWLGGGGMGRVYEAIDTELDERIALKVLKGLTDEAVERFRREVRLTRKIQHRNVARMFDIGAHGDEKFLTMELIDGTSLAPEARSAPLTWARLRSLAEQLAAGLAAAHRAGVIHRDLKPDNVLIERGTGRAVLTDFGIARGGDDPTVTQVGAVIGTPRYMSPEQLAGGEIDARSDLFSLGVLLYELASGARPWLGDTMISVAVAQATVDARPLVVSDAPASFIALVEQCLALDPALRPASADEVLAALQEVDAAGASPVPDVGASAPVRPTPAPTTAGAAIAVLPLTCAPGDEYLADGVLDDLIDSLSTTPSLRVRPAGMVRSRTEPDPRVVGRELAVDHVVVGSVRRIPTGLRITARLLSVADGFQIWAHRQDCSEADVLRISEELGRGIANALSTRAQTVARPTDPRAVELYLRARAELRRFWGMHAQAAAELLEEAAGFAPNSEPILGALAFARTQAWVLRSEPGLASAARKAIERGLTSGHGEAYLASAIYKFNRRELEAGAVDLAIALIRAPMSAQAHEAAGRILVELDARAEALRHFDAAVGLDPGRSQLIASDIARLDALDRNWDSSCARVDRLLADPDPSIARLGYLLSARLASWRGDTTTMLASSRKFPTRTQDNAGLIAVFVTAMIETPDAPDLWTRFAAAFAGGDRPNRQQLLALQLMTEIAMVTDRPTIALECLKVANERCLMDIVWLDQCPLLAPISHDPEFLRIRSEIAPRASRVLAAFRSATA